MSNQVDKGLARSRAWQAKQNAKQHVVTSEAGEAGILDTSLTKRTSHVVAAGILGMFLGYMFTDLTNLDIIRKVRDGGVLNTQEEEQLKQELSKAIASVKDRESIIEHLRAELASIEREDGINQWHVDEVMTQANALRETLRVLETQLAELRASDSRKSARIAALESVEASFQQAQSELDSIRVELANVVKQDNVSDADLNAIISKLKDKGLPFVTPSDGIWVKSTVFAQLDPMSIADAEAIKRAWNSKFPDSVITADASTSNIVSAISNYEAVPTGDCLTGALQADGVYNISASTTFSPHYIRSNNVPIINVSDGNVEIVNNRVGWTFVGNAADASSDNEYILLAHAGILLASHFAVKGVSIVDEVITSRSARIKDSIRHLERELVSASAARSHYSKYDGLSRYGNLLAERRIAMLATHKGDAQDQHFTNEKVGYSLSSYIYDVAVQYILLTIALKPTFSISCDEILRAADVSNVESLLNVASYYLEETLEWG